MPRPDAGAAIRDKRRFAGGAQQGARIQYPTGQCDTGDPARYGELAGVSYEELVYEGYGPGGVAVLLEIMTDNRNRTAGEIRYLFSKHGGNCETGCVAWMFDRRGLLVIDECALDEEELLEAALEAGAEDLAGGRAAGRSTPRWRMSTA